MAIFLVNLFRRLRMR